MTQYIDRGIELDKVDPDTLFGFPISCRFKSCKGMMNSEAELKTHQHECHPRKDPCFASSCQVCNTNKMRGGKVKRRSFVMPDGFKKHLSVHHASIIIQDRPRCPCCQHVLRKELPENAIEIFRLGKKTWKAAKKAQKK